MNIILRTFVSPILGFRFGNNSKLRYKLQVEPDLFFHFMLKDTEFDIIFYLYCRGAWSKFKDVNVMFDTKVSLRKLGKIEPT